MAVENAKKARDDRSRSMNSEKAVAFNKMESAINRLWIEFGKQAEMDV